MKRKSNVDIVEAVLLKKRQAIVMLATESHLFAAAVVCMNVLDVQERFIGDIVVITNSPSSADIDRLSSISPSVQVRIISDEEISEISGEDLLTSDINKNFISRFSILCLAKPIVFKMLDEYEKVLFLDVDTYLLPGFDEVFELSGVAWRKGHIFSDKIPVDYEAPEFKTLDLLLPVPNAGVLFLSDDIPYKDIYFAACSFVKRHFGRVSAIDEVSIAWAVHSSGVKPHDFGENYNIFPGHVDATTRIVHTVGKNKIWNHAVLNLAFPDWQIRYQRWIGLGGSPYTGEMAPSSYSGSLGEFITAAQLTEIWPTVLDNLHEVLPQNCRIEHGVARSTNKIDIVDSTAFANYQVRVMHALFGAKVRLELNILYLGKNERQKVIEMILFHDKRSKYSVQKNRDLIAITSLPMRLDRVANIFSEMHVIALEIIAALRQIRSK